LECIDSKVSSFKELPSSAIVACSVYSALMGRRCANRLRTHDERPLVAWRMGRKVDRRKKGRYIVTSGRARNGVRSASSVAGDE